MGQPVTTSRRIWSLSWRLVVCGLLLLWIFHAIFLNEGRAAWQRQGLAWDSLSRLEQWKTGWSYGSQELWRTLHLVDLPAFLLSLVFMGLTIILGALRWRLVLGVQGLRLPMGRTLEISLVAQFFNAFLLGSTGGDLLKAYYAARETHHKKTEAVVTVFVDRLIGLFSMLLFAVLMMIPNWALLQDHPRLATLAGLVVAMMLGCGLLAVMAFWGGISRHWPKARHWLLRLPKGEVIERSLSVCRRFGQEPAFLVKSLLLSMLINLLCVWQVSAVAAGLNLHISSQVMLLVVPMIICVSALPITPSGLGVRENLFVLILAVPQIHIEATKALTLSLLAYAGFLAWSLMGGVVYLCLRESQHLDEVTKPERTAEDAVDNGTARVPLVQGK